MLNKPPGLAVQGGPGISVSLDRLAERELGQGSLELPRQDSTSARRDSRPRATAPMGIRPCPWRPSKQVPLGCRLVHRLDKDTSGAIVLARTADAAAWLSAAFGQPSRQPHDASAPGRAAVNLLHRLAVTFPRTDQALLLQLPG